jgi:hypothetical protein
MAHDDLLLGHGRADRRHAGAGGDVLRALPGHGEPACDRRARGFWMASRVFTLLGFNVLVWGHVVYGLWSIWRG